MPRKLPDELRDNWGRAYQFLFVQAVPPAYIEQFTRFQQEAGMTDRLIVAVIERAVEQKRRHHLAWTQTVLAGLVPYGVTTPEEWAEFEAEQAAEEQRLANERAAEQARLKVAAGGQQRPAKGVPTAFASLQQFIEEAGEEEKR